METKKVFEWIITPTSPPRYLLRCSKCGKKTEYYCSEKFRINAQKKLVDVWLIYKCENCDTTRNIDIITRMHSNKLNIDEYELFLDNDIKTAWRYAFNKDVIKKNRVIVDYSKIEYIMSGDILLLEEISNREEDFVEFEIKFDYDIELDIAYVIRKNLMISVSQFNRMIDNDIISTYPSYTGKRLKVKYGQKVIINRKKLQSFLKEAMLFPMK